MGGRAGGPGSGISSLSLFFPLLQSKKKLTLKPKQVGNTITLEVVQQGCGPLGFVGSYDVMCRHLAPE